ncbi:hypothetical protein EON65_10935 [archaeon]|nr:MAG: hypothetical protein EON65_10935 [archaeon]
MHVFVVDHVNLVLGSHHIEPIYGLHLRDALHEVLTPPDEKAKPSGSMVSLIDLAKASLPSCPIKPQLSLHWLAVQGVQPNIPENPRILPPDLFSQLPPTLPKELQILYARIVHIITSSTGSTSSNKSRFHPAMQSVYGILHTDSAIQDLVPYFSRFLYHQIKANIRDLKVTTVCIRVIKALDSNACVTLEHHLTQLLPAIFTCVLSAKLTPKVSREAAEEVRSGVCSSL